MNNLVRQTVYIIILSVFLAFIRYSFLNDDKLFNASINKDNQSVEENLEKYLSSINESNLNELAIQITFSKKLI